MEDEEIDRLTKRSDELIQQSKELIDKSHEVIDESSTLKELARQVKEKRRKKIPPGYFGFFIGAKDLLLLDLGVVGMHATRILHGFDQVLHFGLLRVVLHNGFVRLS